MNDLFVNLKKLPAFLVLASALALSPLIGCTSQSTATPTEEATFTYSENIDDNGYWKDTTATEYVELPSDYSSIQVPKDTYTISDESLQNEISTLTQRYVVANEVTDRAVVDGDTVNIDYVGTIDGVAFENGSTQEQGTDVTIGETQYIDDFLEQLIGHTPGETFDVEVTFPADYQSTDVAGKDAVFTTTINYISEKNAPVLTDEFVTANFSSSDGWTTVAQMNEGVRSQLQDQAVDDYINTYVVEKSNVKSVPDQLMKYQERALVSYYQEYATYYEMNIDEFISSKVGAENLDALLASQAESFASAAEYSLVVQAIAEEQGITVEDNEIATYFKENLGTDDYSSYEEKYGKPYLKQVVLTKSVGDYLRENAKLAS